MLVPVIFTLLLYLGDGLVSVVALRVSWKTNCKLPSTERAEACLGTMLRGTYQLLRFLHT